MLGLSKPESGEMFNNKERLLLGLPEVDYGVLKLAKYQWSLMTTESGMHLKIVKS